MTLGFNAFFSKDGEEGDWLEAQIENFSAFLGDLASFIEAVPFNHWKYDTIYLVRIKTSYQHYYIEIEAKDPTEAVEKAVLKYFGDQE